MRVLEQEALHVRMERRGRVRRRLNDQPAHQDPHTHTPGDADHRYEQPQEKDSVGVDGARHHDRQKGSGDAERHQEKAKLHW